jgi:hypothetical protein
MSDELYHLLDVDVPPAGNLPKRLRQVVLRLPDSTIEWAKRRARDHRYIGSVVESALHLLKSELEFQEGKETLKAIIRAKHKAHAGLGNWAHCAPCMRTFQEHIYPLSKTRQKNYRSITRCHYDQLS